MTRSLTTPPGHHFFGFHDVSPWDETGRYVLAHEVDFIDRPPRAEDVVRICVIDTQNNNALEVLGGTRAWNFHQGARLQWIPGKKNKIIYNDRRKDEHGWDKFVSIVFDTETKQEKSLEYPVYAVSPDGVYGLGLDFAWLAAYGGYGYALTEGKTTPKNPIPEKDDILSREKSDGIFRIDFETKKAEIFISTYYVAVAVCGREPIPEEHHILTHIAFNPSGTRIAFLDKYHLPDGGFMQRLVTINPDGGELYVFPGHITHYYWKSDNEIFAFGKYSPGVMALRQSGLSKNPILKPFLNIARKMRGNLKQKIAGQSYLLFQDKSQTVERVGVGVMTEDGHPQFSPDGRWVVTDTYADKNHERTLILWDWENKKRIDLGKFYSLPKENKEITLPNGKKECWDISQMRADLHPRWNRNGTKICIDSVHEGTRQMYAVDVGHLTGNM